MNKKISLSLLLLLLITPFIGLINIRTVQAAPIQPNDTVALTDTAGIPAFSGFWSHYHSHSLWVCSPVHEDLIVTNTYPKPDTLKVTLDLTASRTATYTITLSIDLEVEEYEIEEGKIKIKLLDGNEFEFDWEDVIDAELTSSSDFINNKFSFTITVDMVAGENLFIDPTTVALVTMYDGKDSTTAVHQRKTFRTLGRYWVFYANRTGINLKTSTDGITWSAATVIKVLGAPNPQLSSGQHFSTWNNDTHVAWAWGAQAQGGDEGYFRMGTLNADGTITWLAAAQVFTTGAFGNCLHGLSMTLDSGGYPWIGSGNKSGGALYITKSSTNDGTWATAGGFPYLVNATPAHFTVIALNASRIYYLYGYTNGPGYGREWNGTAWLAEETFTSIEDVNTGTSGISAVAIDGDVYAVWKQAPDSKVMFSHRYSNGTWDTEYWTGYILNIGPQITKSEDETLLYVFWGRQPGGTTSCTFNCLPYDVTSGTWFDIIPVTVETDTGAVAPFGLTSDYQENDGYISIVWTRGNPESVRHLGFTPTYEATITNMDGCGNWVHEGRTLYNFYMHAMSFDGGENISMGIGFYDDAGDWYSFFYNHTTGRITLVSPDDGISATLTSVEASGINLYLNFSVMFNTPVADSFEVDLYTRFVDLLLGDSGWVVETADHFNIYNLGGYVSTQATGPAGRYEGGDAFELYAARGGRVRSNITYRNLQHVGFLFEINFPTWDDFGPGSFGYIEYGMDFCIDDTWYQGLVARLEPWDMGVDVTNAWMEYYVSFYYNGSFVGDLPVNVIALWEAGTAFTTEKQVARIWVDLWFNRMNASTVMGARVNSYWYGMRKEVTWWNPFTWWANWIPLMTNYTQAMWFQNLELDDGIHSCTEITMMKAWCEIYHADLEHEDFNLSAINYDIFNIEIEEGSMRGIDTPIFTDTKIFEKANQGFFAALVSALTSGFERLSEGTWMGLLAGFTYFVNFIDVITGYIVGFPVMSTMVGIVDSAIGFLITLVAEGYIFSMITIVFTTVTSTFGHILYWFTSVITTFTDLFTIVWSLIDGTYTGVGVLQDMWATFGWAEWSDAVPIFIIINWFLSLDNRARKAGGGWIGFFIGDIMMIGGLIALFLNVSMIVINLTLGLIEKVMNMIPFG